MLPQHAWPTGFPTARQAWRNGVFAVAGRWRQGQVPAAQLLSAALMWGYGVGYGPRRSERLFATPGLDKRLNLVLDSLREIGPIRTR